MSKHHALEFSCQNCSKSIEFSILQIEKGDSLICCSSCSKKYAFDDKDLIRQLKLFIALCKQLQESEEILSHTSVGIDLGEHRVKIPYKILLTRLTSTLDLLIGEQPISFSFRFEPLELGEK